MRGSGYRTAPALVRRADGQTLQLTPVLYAVLEAVDGRRSYAEIASVVTETVRRDFSEDMVKAVVNQHLRPIGVLKLADGSEPPVKRSNPLLALKLKFAVTDPRTTRRLTDPFRVLFKPVLVSAVVLGFLAITWWVFFDQGLAPAAYDAFQRPHLLLLVFVVTVLSGGFHEFGHAAAARYGGSDPGVIGAGIYLVWPAFYTDVTDSYRLGRLGRIRTDLGGLYFNAIVAVGIAAAWWITRWDALLLIVAAQIVQMIRQLVPLVRFDGYHVLADVIGVPDLFSRIGPILLSFWPSRWHDPRVTQLKWWARALVTLWVVVVVPVLLFTLFTLVVAVPRLIGTAWASLLRERAVMIEDWSAGRLLDAVGAGVAIVGIAFSILAMLLMITRVVRSGGRTLWRR